MTVHHKLSITGPGAPPPGPGSPVSNPPGYNLDFGPPRSRMHEFGHIWFNQDSQPVTIELEIETVGFVFDNAGTADGTLALFISRDPAVKASFNSFGGVFSQPELNLTNPPYTKLTFTSSNHGGAFYYQLNVRDPNNVLVQWDPIIVNQP